MVFECHGQAALLSHEDADASASRRPDDLRRPRSGSDGYQFSTGAGDRIGPVALVSDDETTSKCFEDATQGPHIGGVPTALQP